MPDNVPTNGFVVPPTNVVNGGVNIPPPDMKPGFVSQVPAADPAPAAAANPATNQTPTAGSDLTAAIAALTAAMSVNTQTAVVPPVTSANPESLNSLNLDTIEDPMLKSMATVMKSLGTGLDMDRVFGKAFEHGNADLLDIAYLREKGGANAEQLVTIAQGIVNASNAAAVAVAAGIHTMAGGEANWNASTTAFNTKAPQELRQVVATMMDSGKTGLVNAAAKLVVEFAKGSGFVPTNNPMVNSGAVMASGAGLSKAEFQEALQKLKPQDRNYQTQRNELFAQRTVGKQLGK